MLLSSEGEEAPAPANPHAGGTDMVATWSEAIVDALLGTVAAKDGLAAGTLELRLVDPDGAPSQTRTEAGAERRKPGGHDVRD